MLVDCNSAHTEPPALGPRAPRPRHTESRVVNPVPGDHLQPVADCRVSTSAVIQRAEPAKSRPRILEISREAGGSATEMAALDLRPLVG